MGTIANAFGLTEGIALTIGATIAFIIRGLSLKFDLNLPRSNFEKQDGRIRRKKQ